MSDLPTRMDWLLHITRGHTPTKEWEGRKSLKDLSSADELLARNAPVFRDEVIRLREIVKVVEDAVKTHIAWEAGASETFVAWIEFAWELHDMLYGGEEE